MLDEKRLAAAMKEAWRGAGYRFVLCNEILSVRADGWGFQAAVTNVPPKVLGLITEHLGSIMEDGFAFLLKKGEPEQSVMLDQEGTKWADIRRILKTGTLAEMKQTPLTLNGFEIWQEQTGLKTRMVDPANTRIIENGFRQMAKAETDGYNGLLLWTSMAGTIAFVLAEPDDDGKLDRLDGYPWCGE